ncbi:MAG: cytochrome-c peroxidase [Luteibaculaceae bacterium]
MLGKSIYRIICFGCFAFTLVNCSKDLTEETALESLQLFKAPPHFPQAVYQSERNPITKEGVELGKMLFYDKRLSADGTISCASCHHQEAAFSDPGMQVSTGVHGLNGKRNSTPIFNAAWHPHFMWDGGINHLEIMPIAPFEIEEEMGMDLFELVQRIASFPEYRAQFNKAFGSDTVFMQRILFAIAQFQSILISADSKYDHFILGRGTLTPDELKGLEVFRIHCGSCHTEPLFTNFQFENNGSPKHVNGLTDYGRYEVSTNPQDKGKFRVPSLRNVMLTAPYMHNGSLATLVQVLENYDNLDNNSEETLNLNLKSGVKLTQTEKNQLIAFLHTLTDNNLTTNPAFSNPWNQ